jgi:ABC-2 type transport system permease protein
MSGFRSLSRAMVLGFVRDRTALFFTVVFPLMFLVLFGSLFKDSGAPKAKVVEIGSVEVLDQIPSDARGQLDKVLTITKTTDAAKAIDSVRKGDYEAAIEQQGDRVIVHYSAADQVRAGVVQGIMESLVQDANLAATGTPPKLKLDAAQVEDRSLKTIQYITPGLLGWAIATGATFGAALTLVTWRQKKILRRLRLSPVRLPSVIGARVGVSIAIALGQTAIFVGVAMLPYFGLKLSNAWWMSVPLVIAGTLAFMSMGLLAGAWAKTSEAATAVANLIVLPMAFLSGSFFPLDNAPSWLQQIAKIFPLRHLVTAMQDVMVRGKSAVSVLPEIGLLLAIAVVLAAIAGKLFRWDDI